MAIDKLGIYNDALLLLGQTSLASETEDREIRYKLDDTYNLNAVDYCLELSQPTFANKTIELNSALASSEHDLDSVHTLPSDYISIVGVYSDSKLDQEISRYLLEDDTLACEYPTIYLRYTSNGYELSKWSAAFAYLVSVYLATKLALRYAPDELELIDAAWTRALEAVENLNVKKESGNRAKASTSTLSTAWLKIYNDALQILGLEKIVNNNDDSDRRSKLDTALDSNLVEALLEDIGWHFAIQSMKSQYDPNLEPEWGYQRVHAKPPKMHRLEGIFQDEYMNVPLKDYFDEGNVIFTNNNEFYIQFVSTDFLVNPDLWQPSFRRLVAAKLAKDAGPSIPDAMVENAMIVFEERDSAARSVDAMQSPPRKLSTGSWVNSKFQGSLNNGRPYAGRR